MQTRRRRYVLMATVKWDQGYHSQRTCINDECNVDTLRSNTTDKVN